MMYIYVAYIYRPVSSSFLLRKRAKGKNKKNEGNDMRMEFALYGNEAKFFHLFDFLFVSMTHWQNDVCQTRSIQYRMRHVNPFSPATCECNDGHHTNQCQDE